MEFLIKKLWNYIHYKENGIDLFTLVFFVNELAVEMHETLVLAKVVYGLLEHSLLKILE